MLDAGFVAELGQSGGTVKAGFGNGSRPGSFMLGCKFLDRLQNRGRCVVDLDVLVGNVEQMSLNFEANSFDAIIMTELLEHLVNPWQIVNQIKTYLKPNGIIVASSPNVRHFSIIWKLINGSWNYQERGILDKTHLRFFTKSTFIDLFTQAGLEVELIEPIINKKYHFINNLFFKKLIWCFYL